MQSLYVLKRKGPEFRKPDWALPAARSARLEAARLNNSKNWASIAETDNISILGLLLDDRPYAICPVLACGLGVSVKNYFRKYFAH